MLFFVWLRFMRSKSYLLISREGFKGSAHKTGARKLKLDAELGVYLLLVLFWVGNYSFLILCSHKERTTGKRVNPRVAGVIKSGD